MKRFFILALCLFFSADAPTQAATQAPDQAIPVAYSPPNPSTGQTLLGLDVLQRNRFAALEGQRVGLITNHTGLDRNGVSTARLLLDAPNVQLKALFSPEHGFSGHLDQENIGDTKDDDTGIPVYSLYGETRQPTADMLLGLDTLVFDIQDIGTRFYTYISTLGLAMEAAAVNGLRFVVLDRPNPINGVDVAGPLADDGRESFVAFHRLPVRHGMTIGELAHLFRAERGLDVDLQVIALENWNRAAWFDATGLQWVNPSPNMRSLKQAMLYPGIGWLETTNLSVGRGTDTPFEWFGAPWIDGKELSARLNARGIPGVRFIPVTFTPDSSKFANEDCGGANLLVTDRARFDPVRTGLEIAVQLRALYPGQWEISDWDRLLVNGQTLEAVRNGRTAAEVEAAWSAELDSFLVRRAEFLLYD